MSKQDENVRWVNRTFNGKKSIDKYQSVKDAIEALQEALEAEKRGEWKDLILEIETEYDISHLVITGKRPENDAERQDRERREKQQEAYQRKMYEDLKKKFGV